jgi:Tol biopolymer transport system component
MLCILLVAVMPGAVFAVDSVTPLSRVSTDVNGNQVTGGGSLKPTLSADGRYVAFRSDATNVIPSDTNGVSDIFVKDIKTGAVTCVSCDSSGTLSNGSSINPSISANGQFVVFQSGATNLVAGDTNGTNDVFVKNLVNLTISRVSTDSSGAQGAGSSGGSAISSDGRYILFVSTSTTLVAGDTNGTQDAFIKDTTTNATTRVSTDSASAQVTGTVSGATLGISADGRYAVFGSSSTTLVAGDTNGVLDVFVKDTQTGATTRVSTDSAGAQGNGAVTVAGGGGFSISGNGRYVSFITAATNMVAGDTNGVLDIFVKDLTTGVTTLASADDNGVQGNGAAITNPPAFTYDGRYIAFASDATNLVPNDTNALADVFMKDMSTGKVVRVSTDSAGLQGNASSTSTTLSSDAKYIIFTSSATNLVPNDTNAAIDIFYRIGPFWIEPVVATPTTPGVPNTGLPQARTSYLPGVIILVGTGFLSIGIFRRRFN